MLESSEAGLITSQLVTSLGKHWDNDAYNGLTHNTAGFKFGTFLALLESKYLVGSEQPVLQEVVSGLADTFLRDVIKKVWKIVYIYY